MGKICLHVFLAVLLFVVWGNQCGAQYIIDDGVSEIALGHGLSGDFLFGNYFDEVTGQETITNIAVAISDGGITMGDPMEVILYEDTDDDGDPTTGLSFLVSVATTVDMPEPVGTDTFQVVDIPDTVISGGFFVAVFMDGTNNPFPGKMDQSTSVMQSWFAEHDILGSLDITDPFGTGTLFGLVDDFAFPGNWLLRANVDDGDCLLGDVNLDGTVDLLDVTPFVIVVTAGDFQCEADVNEDGTVDLLDVTPFVDLLTGG